MSSILTEEQKALLDELKAGGLQQLPDMTDADILESLKALARPMFESLLQESKVTTTRTGDNISFKLETNNLIEPVMGYVIDNFLRLMQSYQNLYGTKKIEVGKIKEEDVWKLNDDGVYII